MTGGSDVFNGSTGSTQLIADVVGYYVAGAPVEPGSFAGVTPFRVLDTGQGTGAPGPVGGGESVRVKITDEGGLPATGVSAVLLNVTVVNPEAAGYVAIYSGIAEPPSAGSVEFAAGQTVSNLVVATVEPDGTIGVLNGSAGTTELIGDVAGYFLAGTPTASGTLVPLAATRVLETRESIGAAGPVRAGRAIKAQISGRGGVPESGVNAVLVNVTVRDAAVDGTLTVYPAGSVRPSKPTADFVAGQATTRLMMLPIGDDGAIQLFNGSGGQVQITADITGYYRLQATAPIGPISWTDATQISPNQGNPISVSCPTANVLHGGRRLRCCVQLRRHQLEPTDFD